MTRLAREVRVHRSHGGVDLEVAIGADQLKPLRVFAELLNSDAPPSTVVAPVGVMEVESSRAAVIPTDGTPPAKSVLYRKALNAFFLAPALLLAWTTAAPPSLVAFVGEGVVAVQAITRTSQVDRGAPMLVPRAEHLPTLPAAPPLGEAILAEIGFAVLPIGNFGPAGRAIERWIRLHGASLRREYSQLAEQVQP